MKEASNSCAHCFWRVHRMLVAWMHLFSLTWRCKLQTHVCWVAWDPNADAGIFLRCNLRNSTTRDLHEMHVVVDSVSKPCRCCDFLVVGSNVRHKRMQHEYRLVTLWTCHSTNVQKENKKSREFEKPLVWSNGKSDSCHATFSVSNYLLSIHLSFDYRTFSALYVNVCFL
jgi:hypothetical protein